MTNYLTLQNQKINILILILIFALFFLGCSAPKKFVVLIHMMPEQEEYFKNKVIPPFEEKENCEISVISYKNVKEIEKELEKYKGKTALVKTPFEQTKMLAEKNLFSPINKIVSEKRYNSIKRDYFLLDLATIDGNLYFMPRKFETRIMVYLKSKVNDAVYGWGVHRVTIDSILKKINGYGLPADYFLEEDPNEWDYYDIFVIGYYWAHKDSNKVAPKIAHRGKRYAGTVQRMIDRIYQLGGTKESVIKMKGQAVEEMFKWEAIYTHCDIYNPKMWTQDWSGFSVWEGFKNDEVYLSFMTQIDCFFLHGNYTKQRPGFVENPDDLGYAVMPKGVSLKLDNKGYYVKEGKRSISTGGWWWGIPKDSPYPQVSIDLAQWILNTDNQMEGCAEYGMIPVRKDILGDLGLLFGKSWISNIYEASLKQLVENKYTTVPQTKNYDKLVSIYLDAIYEIKNNYLNKSKIYSEINISDIILKYSKKIQKIDF